MRPPFLCEPPVFASEDVQAELGRILSSPEFRHAERLTRLLRHVVERTLEGATDRLKESLLGREVFDRSDFDPRVDPIVRVEASRLRKRLEDFYRRGGCPSGVAIGLPKGTYAASFERHTMRCAPMPASSSKLRRRLAVVALGSECTGVADQLIHQVVGCGGFDVVPWTSPPTTEAQALQTAVNSDVDVLVCVFERRNEQDARVFVRATDVRRGVYLASEFAVLPLAPAAAHFFDQLQSGTSSGEAQSVRPVPTPAAYNLYLKGRFYWNLRTEAGLWKAVDYFRQAMVENPVCALACAGLADAYTLLANYGAVAPDEVRPKAKEYALRGMEIDGTLAEAHTSLAHVHATYEWDWKTAELEYLTAIRLNSSYATAHHWYAITLLTPLRRLDEALDEIRRARECDAISLSIRRDEGLVRLYRGESEAANGAPG